MYKVWKSGNYIKVVTPDGTRYKGICKEVAVYANSDDSRFTITNLIIEKDNILYSEQKLEVIPIEEIAKENGDNYTLEEWELFYTENTGNYGGGGGTSSDALLTEIRDAVINNKEKEMILPITEFTETQVGTDWEYLIEDTEIKIINSVEMGEVQTIIDSVTNYEIISGTTNVKLLTSIQIPSTYFVRITGSK